MNGEPYTYEGVRVTVRKKFSDFWLHVVEGGDGQIHQGFPGKYQPISSSQATTTTGSNPPSASTPSNSTNKSTKRTTNVRKPRLLQVPSSTEGSTGGEPEESERASEKDYFYLNAATTKSQIAQAMAGIGNQYASKILDRKPPEGYHDWEELQEINQDLSVDWVEVQTDNPHVQFTPAGGN